MAAQKLWRQVPVKERVEYCRRFVAAFVAKKAEIARELTMQMGRYASTARASGWRRGQRASRTPGLFARRCAAVAGSRPVSQTPGEVNGTQERATYMINIAEECLKDIEAEPKPGTAAAALCQCCYPKPPAHRSPPPCAVPLPCRLPPLHPPGAAGRRVRHRGVELPVPHLGQLRHPGHPRRYGG